MTDDRVSMWLDECGTIDPEEWEKITPGAALGEHYGLVLSADVFRRLAGKMAELGPPPPVILGVDLGKGEATVISQAFVDEYQRVNLWEYHPIDPREFQVEKAVSIEPRQKQPYYRRFGRKRRKGRKGW